MKLTLLVEDNPKIESFFKLNLLTWLGMENIVTKISSAEAITYLEGQASETQLIILRSTIKKIPVGRPVIEYLQSKNLSIPVITIGPEDLAPYPKVANSLDIKNLIKTAAKALNITAQEMSLKKVPDLFPIPITYFSAIKRPVCEVYAYDKDSKSYQLKIPKLQDINEALLNELASNGTEYLYVDKLNRLDFVHNVTSELITTLGPMDLSPDEQVVATDKSIELLSKKLLSIGVTEETVNLAKKNMDMIKSNVKANPKLSKLLSRLLENKSSYLFKHTQILTYVSLHIIRNIEWGTPEQEEKISFISFFHDIALENDIQCEIKSTNELRKAKLTPDQKEMVEKHAQVAAEFISKFPHSPMGADQIIRQHHGQLNGIGFSEHFGNNVSPISIVFIVAEEFTRIIMKNDLEKYNREEMIRELKEQFPTSRFAKIIEKLQTIIL